MSPAGPARVSCTLAAVAAALLLLAACSGNGGADEAASTTTEARVTRTTGPPTSVKASVPGLDCGALAESGLPEARGAFTVPGRSVTYAAGSAVVLLTPAGDEQRCLDLALADGPSDGPVLDPSGKGLKLRWEDGRLAFEIVVTGEPIAEGPIDAFTRVEENGRVWGDSLHDECEVALTGLGDSSIDGTVTCRALSSFSNDAGPAAIVATFHAET